MNEFESMEASAVTQTGTSEADAGRATEPAAPILLPEETEAVRAVYPDFDPDAALSHPVLGPLLRGEAKPTLRQLYEAVYLEDILQGRIAEAVEKQVSDAVSTAVHTAVNTAVEEAVRGSEERLLDHIRARGYRPAENGTSAAAGIRMHPAVERLTRRERAMLARRAENGETIKL